MDLPSQPKAPWSWQRFDPSYVPPRSHEEQEAVRSLDKSRELVSSVFIGFLVTLAFQQMIEAVKSSFHAQGLTLGLAALFLSFFLTTLRFFIGNQLHLVSFTPLELPEILWVYDFCFIGIATTILIFMGGLCSVEASRASAVGFIGLMCVLFAVDLVWLVSRWFISLIRPACRTPRPLWTWAALDIAMLCGILIPISLVGDPYTPAMLVWLAGLNIAVFTIDVIIIDPHRRASTAREVADRRKKSTE